MKKILIAGGAGYVGGHLTDLLAKNKKYQVTVLDNLLYEKSYLKDVNFIFEDVLNTKKMSKIIKKYDVVIWLAAIVGDGACAVNPELTLKLNYESLKIFKNFKGKLIFLSTCSVYGMNNNFLDENSPTNPLSLYAKTKLDAEFFLKKNVKKLLIFRLGTLFGVSDEHSRIRFDLVANVLSLKSAIGQKLEVFGGDQWRPLMHVKDVANSIIFALNKNINGLFNLSYKNYTIRDIALEIKKVNKSKVVFSSIKFEDKRNYKLKSPIFNKMGFKPKFNLKFGINEIIKIVKENRVTNPFDTLYNNMLFNKKINETKNN